MKTHFARATTVAMLAATMGCNGIDESGAHEESFAQEASTEEDLGEAEQSLTTGTISPSGGGGNCVYGPNAPSVFDDTGTLNGGNPGYEELQGGTTGGCDRYITSIELNATVHTLRIASNGLIPCKPDYNMDAWVRNNSSWTKLNLTKQYRGGTIWEPVCYVEGTFTFPANNGYDELVTASRIAGQNPGFDVFVERW